MFGNLTLHAEALHDKSFAVFDIPGAGVFREEMLSLLASGSLSQHRFQFGNELYEKPGIFEADLHSEHVLAMVPHFHDQCDVDIRKDLCAMSCSQAALQFSKGLAST